MTEKVVTTRKPHKCEHCEGEIPAGSQARRFQGRSPKYADSDDQYGDGPQIGIEYFVFYIHEPLCEMPADKFSELAKHVTEVADAFKNVSETANEVFK